MYFVRVQRDQVGQLCRCLAEKGGLPSWACLAVSFIGTSICEVICHEPLQDRLVATMKAIGFSHLPSYDLLKTRSSKTRAKRVSLKACVRRFSRCAVSGSSTATKKLYVQALSNLKRQYLATVADELDMPQDSNNNKGNMKSSVVSNNNSNSSAPTTNTSSHGNNSDSASTSSSDSGVETDTESCSTPSVVTSTPETHMADE